MATPSTAHATPVPNLFTLALSAKPAALAASPATNLTPQVHLLLLHPRSAARPPPALLQALHAQLRAQHPGARVLASSVAYPRCTSALAAQTRCSAWSELALDAAAQVAAEEVEALLGGDEESGELELEGLDEENGNGKERGKANVLAGLVAAIEHFTSLSPLPQEAAPTSLEPPRAPVLARHVLHVSSVALALPPASTALATALNSHHDTWSLAEVAQGLREAGISCSTLILPDAARGAGAVSDARALHAQLGGEDHASTDDEVRALLGGHADAALPHGAVLLIRDLSNAPGGASLVRKRSRSKASASPGATALAGDAQGDAKRRKANAPSSSSAAAAAAAAPQAAPAPAAPMDAGARTLLSRVMFLQQQVGMMMSHLALAARNDAGSGAKDAGREAAIEKLRAKLGAVRHAFQTQHAALAAGGAAPELNASIAALLAVNTEAAQLGIELGLRAAAASAQAGGAPGASGQNAAAQAQAQAQIVAQQHAAAQAQAVAAANAQAAQAQAQPPAFPSRAQPIWQGPICWSVTDPSTGAKREVQTVVSATASTKTFSGNMSLPWPARLLMQSTIPLHMPSLHAFGMRNTPCVLFTSKAPPGADNDALRTAHNDEAYRGFASMLEQRKLCGFVPWREGHGSPGGGILVVATPTPAAGQANVRLFGLIFQDSGPLKQLIAAATAAQRLQKEKALNPAAPGVPPQQPGQIPPTANATPAQVLFQSPANASAAPGPPAAGQPAAYTQQQLDVQRQVALQLQNARTQQRLQGMQNAQLIMAQQAARGPAAGSGSATGAGAAAGAGTQGFTTQPSLSAPGFAQGAAVPGPPNAATGGAWNFPANPAAAAYAAANASAAAAAPQQRAPSAAAWNLMGAGAAAGAAAGGGGGVGAADMAALSAQLGLGDGSAAQAGGAGVQGPNGNLWGNWSAQPAQQQGAQGNQAQGNQAQQQPDYAMLQRMLSGNQQQP